MKNFFLSFLMFFLTCIQLHAQKELILNSTGNGVKSIEQDC